MEQGLHCEMTVSQSDMSVSHTLRRHWERYLRVPLEPAARAAKTERLDKFLGWALQCATQKNTLPEFSDMHSVSNLLAGEFLVDVHQICSQSSDDDVTILQRYLHAGRGGVILRVLHTIGVQGLSCSQELAELLVSLLPLCLKFPCSESVSEPEMDLCHIGDCFHNSSNVFSNTSVTSSQFSPAAVAMSSKSKKHRSATMVTNGQVTQGTGKSTGEMAFQSSIRNQRTIRHSSGHTSKDVGNTTTTTSSDSEEEYVRVKSPFKFHVTSYPLLQSNATSPLGVFPGLLGSTTDREDAGGGEDDRSLGWSSMEPLPLCVLLLTLARDLCHEDCFQLDNKKSVSVYILPSLVQLFVSLNYDEDQLLERDNKESEVISQRDLMLLKRYFIRVILSVCSYVSSQTSGLFLLHSMNSLPLVLSVAVDVVCKERLRQHELTDDLPNTDKLYLAQDVILGVWLFMEHVFSNIPLNPSALNNALKLFHDIVSHRGLGIIEGLLGLWERVLAHHEERLSVSHVPSEPREQIDLILLVLGRTIRFLKQAKINYIHAVKCSRQKHKKCDFRWYVHHHHDTLGLAGSKPYIPSSESCDSMEVLNSEPSDHSEQDSCAVAAIGEFLLYLYQRSLSRTAQLKILRCLEDAGVCCCMSPGAIMRILTKNLSGHSPAVRNFTLKVLVRVLLEQCGGAEQVQRSKGICHICKDEEHQGVDVDRSRHVDNREVMFIARQETSDSAFSGSDASLHDENKPEPKQPRWRVLRQLQALVLDRQEEEVATQVMQHALTLVSQGSDNLKQELFYCLFLPILQATKAVCERGQGSDPRQASSQPHTHARVGTVTEAELPVPVSVIERCLAGLPLLLQASVVHTMFLNYGGVKQLCQLSQMDCLRNSVLRTFQVLVILEERKLEAEQARMGFEIQTVQRVSEEDTTELTTSDKDIDCETEKAEEAINAMSYTAHVGTHLGSKSGSSDNGSGPKTKLEVESASAAILEAFTTMLIDSKQILKQITSSGDSPTPERIGKLVDVWSACNLLFAQSWQFRHQFLSVDGPGLCLDVLHSSLAQLVTCRDIPGCVPEIRRHGLGTVFTQWLMLVQVTLNVCLASCRVKAVFTVEGLTVKQIMSHMKTSLVSSPLWSPAHALAVKHVCDVLLSTATAKLSQADIIQMQALSVMYEDKDEDSIYDRDLLELNDPSSSKETETCLTEQGYEADSEFLQEETEGLRMRSRSSLKTRSHLCTEDHVTYPEVCRLVVELLAAYHQASGAVEESTAVLPHVLLKVLSLVKHNMYTALSLYNQGLLTVLLDGFKGMLTSTLSSVQVKQKLVLELFLAIAQHSMSSAELKAFLELFKFKGVCLDNLLPIALSLVQSYSIQPSHTLSFPVVKTDFLTHYNISVCSVSSDLLNASIRRVLPPTGSRRDNLTVTSSDSHSTTHLTDGSSSDRLDSPSFEQETPKTSSSSTKLLSPHIPLQMDLKDQSVWPSATNQKGFSISLWLQIEQSSLLNVNNHNSWNKSDEGSEKKGLWDIMGNFGKKCALPDRLRAALRKNLDSRHWSNQCLHLVSIGNDSLKFEVWTEPHCTNLIFRIVSHANGCQKVLSEAAQTTSMESNRWQHLSLAFREESSRDRKRVTISTILDGCFQRDTTMEYTVPGNVQGWPTPDNSLCLGHVVPVEDLEVVEGRWKLGNLMLFKDSQMTKHTSFHIFALGPDCCTLSQCDCTEQTAVYSQFITDDIVKHSGLSHDVLTGNHSIYLQHLRENLVLSFSPHNATAFSLYNTPTMASGAPSSGLKGLLLPTPQPKSAFNPLMHQPVTVQARLVTDLAPQVHKGLTMALDEIGGFPVFLFTFAKVVEMGGTPSQQAEALRLLFTLIQNHPKYAKDFQNMGGHDLLVKVLLTDQCYVGPEILKVLLDVCLSQPTLVYSQSAQRYQLLHDSCALICDGQLVTQLLLAWRVWERAEEGVWAIVFQALQALLRDDHPFQSFNIQQLQNSGVIEKLLMICLERLQEALPALSIPICSSVVSIISKLVGNPPDIHNIMNICDFLMLAHPAASTYVCHDEDDFYFRHKWVKQMSMDFTRLKVKDPALEQNLDMLLDSEQDPTELTRGINNTSTPMKEHPSDLTEQPTDLPLKEQPTDLPLKEQPRDLEEQPTDLPLKEQPGDLEEQHPDLPLKEQPPDDNKYTERRSAKKELFKVRNVEKSTEVKSQSLPTSGFWSKCEQVTTAYDPTSKDTNDSINRLIKKGITDAFKTLASSYPQSLGWSRMANVPKLIHHPKEIDLKELKIGSEGCNLADRELLCLHSSEKASSSSEGTERSVEELILEAKSKTKRKVRSYSETKLMNGKSGEPCTLSYLCSDVDPDSDNSDSDSHIVSKRKVRRRYTRCPSDPALGWRSKTKQGAEHSKDLKRPSSSSASETKKSPEDLKYTSFEKYFPGGNEVDSIPDENENVASCQSEPPMEICIENDDPPKASATAQSSNQRYPSTSSSFTVVEGPQEVLPPAERDEDWLIFSTECVASHNSSSTIGNKVDSEVEDGEQGLVYIYAHLLELLSQIIVKMPQEDFLRVTAVVLKPQILIIMAHHSSAQVRAGVIKVLDIYLLRMTKELEASFLSMQGFHLLACQLHQHESCEAIVEACFTVLLGQPHRLEDDVVPAMLAEMRPIQQMAVVPLIALLENSIHNTSLCHNLLCLLGQVFMSVDSMVLPMLSNGLTEALSNTLSGLAASPPRVTDIGEDERILLIEGVQKFFCCIAEKCFSSGDSVCFQHLEEMFQVLYAIESKHADIHGPQSDEVTNIKTLQSACLRTVFDYTCELLDSQSSSLPKTTTLVGAVGSFLSRLPLPNASSFSEEDEFLSSDEGLPTSQPGLGWPSLGSPNLLSPPDRKPGGSLRSRSLPGTNKESSSLRRQRSFTLDPVRRPRVQSSLDLFTTGLFSSKKNQGVTQGELTDRLKKIVVLATDFVLYTVHQNLKMSRAMSRLESVIEVNLEIVPADVDFSRFLLEFLLKGIVTGLERSIFQRKTLGMSVMWQAKDVLRIQFSRLLVCLLSPHQAQAQRAYTVELLCNEPKFREVLKITHNIKSMGQKVAAYLYELQCNHLSEMSTGLREQVVEVTNNLEQLGVQTYRLGRKLTKNDKAALQEDKAGWNLEFVRDRSTWLRSNEESKKKVLKKLEPMSKKLVTQALEVTQAVTKTQNGQRKKFLEHLKKQMSNSVQVKKTWQQLIQQLTHERAVWHCPESHPGSWQLDPTEGPCRIRRRLQRCHLGIDSKFFTEKNQHKLAAENCDPPLAFLFEDDNLISDSAALIYKLHTSQNIQYTCMCTHVTPSSETRGELLIGQNDLYFVADEAILDANYTQVLLGNKELFLTLAQEDIKGIQKRWFQLRDDALEIFLTNGKTCLLAFETLKEREELHMKLTALEMPNFITDENLEAIQQLWLDGKMTNFEYLTRLNKMAGRSFNDLMQYPVFPFILANYTQNTLDLESKKTFRNLSKPIAVQHKHREEKYIENYQCLKAEQERHGDTGIFEYHPEPYHYGSHYSNSGTVLHFLVRLPPFTQMFLDYQDHSFDLPDRTFHSMETSWRLASLESTTDVKELIPEFFFLPEFLCNKEGYHFGRRQMGARVWDVTLPPWCLNNPRLFTLIHRQALESSHVTQHLSAWIDLVFGFKQQGRTAVEAINVFHPATYFGVDVDSIEDPVRRRAVKTMIKTYGQTPRQLFRVPQTSPSTSGGGSGSKGPERNRGSDRLVPVRTVQGLRWGSYVGSPDQPEPHLTWIQHHRSQLSSLVALPTGGVFGLGPSSSLAVMYSKEKGVTSVTTVDVLWAAIISWGHPDSIIRIKNRKDMPAVNFLHWSTEEQVTCCSAVPDCRLLFFGGTSGVISVINTKFNQSKQSHLQVFGQKSYLYGHSAAVTAFCVCTPFSVLVSASRDNTLIIWDLNRLTYVRSITDHRNPVHALAVSDTLGDIASVSHTDHGSCLMLHTVNAEHVSSAECEELVMCLVFSTAPEGRSVNVVAGGLNNGIIRLWSSWDLTRVRDISTEKFIHPVVSLVFTHDCQRLFAANADGTVAMWEKTSSNRPKDVLFIPFL